MSNKRTSVFRAISFLVLKCGMYGVPYRAGTQTDPELLCPYAEITSQLRHHEVLTSTQKSLVVKWPESGRQDIFFPKWPESGLLLAWSSIER